MENAMKKFLSVLASGSALAAAMSAAPALAQDESTFTGPRVEALVGYDVTKAGSSVDDDTNDDNDQSIDGLLYGIGAGFDFAVGNAVVGVEGEYTDSTAKADFDDDGDFEDTTLGRVKTGRDLYVGARAGIRATPRTLVYAKGGYTNAKFDVLANDGETELEADVKADGWRAGAGVEQAMGENAFAKLEYRYSKYGEAKVDFGDTATDEFDVDLDRHQVVAGVGVRF
jgi:outer membrane immunogenic protein